MFVGWGGGRNKMGGKGVVQWSKIEEVLKDFFLVEKEKVN